MPELIHPRVSPVPPLQISKALLGDDQRLRLPRFLEEEEADPGALGPPPAAAALGGPACCCCCAGPGRGGEWESGGLWGVAEAVAAAAPGCWLAGCSAGAAVEGEDGGGSLAGPL